MERKIYEITTIEDIGNLITEENAEFLITDLISTLELVVNLKERVMRETGKYPVDFFKSVSITFDGVNGVNGASINGEFFNLKKD